MKIFTSNNFHWLWPVPTAAIILADTKEEAEHMLIAELATRGIKQRSPLSVEELTVDYKKVVILSEGNY